MIYLISLVYRINNHKMLKKNIYHQLIINMNIKTSIMEYISYLFSEKINYLCK